jgi:hypothetical protein
MLDVRAVFRLERRDFGWSCDVLQFPLFIARVRHYFPRLAHP